MPAMKSSSSPGDTLSGISQTPTRRWPKSRPLSTTNPIRVGTDGQLKPTFSSRYATACQRACRSSLASTRMPTVLRPGALISASMDSRKACRHLPYPRYQMQALTRSSHRFAGQHARRPVPQPVTPVLRRGKRATLPNLNALLRGDAECLLGILDGSESLAFPL